jgi:hypothetical protein
VAEIFALPVRPFSQDLSKCGGCSEPTSNSLDYVVVTLPYEAYDKQILLCESCVLESRKHGLL